MRLSYRGTAYEAAKAEVDVVGVQPIGCYRGAPLIRNTLLVYSPLTGNTTLKYRGIPYNSQA